MYSIKAFAKRIQFDKEISYEITKFNIKINAFAHNNDARKNKCNIKMYLIKLH